MKTKLLHLVLIALIFSNCTNTPQQEDEMKDYTTETEQDKQARMEWWKDARFGMFIHWGLYAVPAGEYKGEKVEGIGEWIMNSLNIPIEEYEQFADDFNPVKFDASEWVSIAKDAGMKYIVITSKHHDGFALWDSDVTQWDIIDATPYNKDILKELSQACQEQDIKLCFYYSIMDWHHPDAQAMWEPNYNQGRDSENVNPDFPEYIENYMKPQLEELLTNYGDIGVLWFDGEWIPAYTSEMGKEVYNFVRSLQSDIIINNRVDKGRQGMMGLNKEGDFVGDFGTPEQEIPDTGIANVDWESCMTMNDTWGYKHFDDNWKSTETLIHHLVDIVSKGGNFLLNVGPTAEGIIPRPSVERLQAMGDWMDVNSESIYEAQASPFNRPDWGRYTQKNNKIYAHVFDWPENQMLEIPELSSAASVYLLTADGNVDLEIESTVNGLNITLPAQAPDPVASVVAIELD
jgi:alpha-L-fucosidase